MRVLSTYGAAAWALIFGALHALWASGIYILLEAEQAAIAFSRTPFFIYNFTVIIVCIVGVILALIQSNVISTRLSTSFIRFFGYAVVILLSLRGIAGVLHIFYQVVFDNRSLSPMALWDVWFCIGGFLFYLNTKSRPRQTVMF